MINTTRLFHWQIIDEKKTSEIIGEENISEIIEPSVGDGAFLHYDKKPHFAYDILPECESDITSIKKGDFFV